jgi:hypothetical protein
MTLVYRTAGAWGPGKGSDLTPAEADGDLYELDTRTANLETTVIVSIAYITVSGDQMYIHMTDHSIQGPFTLPSGTGAWVFRSAWTSLTAYNVNDVITSFGAVYLVIFAHTSQTTFDPNANDGFGHNFYSLLLAAPAIAVYTVATATFTPGTSFMNSYIRCTNISGCAVTIPQGVFPVDTELHFRASNTNGIVFAGAIGVTLDIPSGFVSGLNIYGATATLKQVAPDYWDIFGLLAPNV